MTWLSISIYPSLVTNQISYTLMLVSCWSDGCQGHTPAEPISARGQFKPSTNQRFSSRCGLLITLTAWHGRRRDQYYCQMIWRWYMANHTFWQFQVTVICILSMVNVMCFSFSQRSAHMSKSALYWSCTKVKYCLNKLQRQQLFKLAN